jgi:hypothetical protein
MALTKVFPCAGRMDDECVANLVHRWCDPATAAGIVADLGWAAADAAAVLVGGGEGGGHNKEMGGEGLSSLTSTLTLSC